MPADGRGHASAGAALLRDVRRDAAQPERRAGAPGAALEIRFQEHQVHRQDPLRRKGAAHHLEPGQRPRIRLLLQRQPAGGSSALEPGVRAPAGGVLQAQDPDVQRIRRTGRLALQRHGPAQVLLTGMPSLIKSRWLKPLVFLACLVPLALLVERGLHNGLGANPIERITHATGDWTMRFLLITLSVTPLRRILRQPDLIRFRRMLGLFAFFYGFLHLMTWLWLDKFFDPHEMWADLVKRRFITAGMTGFALMLPLAVTSTRGWIRRMGGRNWQRLHRLIYFSAAAGVVHYYWLVKSDIRLPVLYGAILAVLLLLRWANRRPVYNR